MGLGLEFVGCSVCVFCTCVLSGVVRECGGEGGEVLYVCVIRGCEGVWG